MAGVKYFTWNTDQWASYDDTETFQQKIEYANTQGLGGIFVWAVNQDDRDFDALRGVLSPKFLDVSGNTASDVSYWQSKTPRTCEVSECGVPCARGYVSLTSMACPSHENRNKVQQVCCPMTATPDPSTCSWRGSPLFCNGHCHGGEVALASSTNRNRGHCLSGHQLYCCPVPQVSAGGISCKWASPCAAEQAPLTFATTFVEDIAALASLTGLVGDVLATALRGIAATNGKQYCCARSELTEWPNCYWAVTSYRATNSCCDNHCNSDLEVELTTCFFGAGSGCFPHVERQRAFCCTPASGESLFLPVPLSDLFPTLESTAIPSSSQATTIALGLAIRERGGQQGTQRACASSP